MTQNNEIDYLDLLYNDSDFELDVTTFFSDGGAHVNSVGAEAVTAFVGNYLKQEYNITSAKNEYFEQHLPYYEKIADVASLQTEEYLENYLEKLIEQENGLSILCVVNGDASWLSKTQLTL